VLAGFATVAAILVSLHLARRSERVRLKVSLSVIISNTMPTTQIACVIITNIGMRAAWLPTLFFEWQIPFRRRQQPEAIANWINVVSANNPNREIKVGQDTFFPVGEMPDFREKMMEEYRRMIEELRWFRKARIKRIGARIYTQDGSEFPVVFAVAIQEAFGSLIAKL
jgi:hypothetical protein